MIRGPKRFVPPEPTNQWIVILGETLLGGAGSLPLSEVEGNLLFVRIQSSATRLDARAADGNHPTIVFMEGFSSSDLSKQMVLNHSLALDHR